MEYSMLGDRFWSDEGWLFSSFPTVAYVQFAMLIVVVGIAVYFIRIWSREWNEKISSSN